MSRFLAASSVIVPLLVAVPAAPARAVQSPPAEAAPKAPRTVAAERGTLELVLERSGRVEPVRSESVRLELEAFGGQVSVKEVLRRSGPVRAGEPVVVLEGKDFERGLDELRTQHAEATRRLEMQREERAMQARQAVAGVERAAVAAELAQQALELHRDYEAAKALEMSDLSLKSSLDSLQDSRDELSQLEKMYSGTSLQSETKDIVLERARRGVERGSVYARYAKRDNEIFKAIRAPNDARRVQDQAKQSSLDLESARLQQRLGEIRAELDLAQAERGLRDLGRRLERMEGDAKRLRVAAPADGFLVVKVREAGDGLQPRQEVVEVVDLSRLRVRGTLGADAIRFAKPGDAVRVWFPARPEVRAEAVIDEIVSVGSPDGEGASFPFVATIRSVDASVLPGLEARVVVRGKVQDRVLVPSKAVKQEKGRFTVRVLADGKEAEREVRVGVSDGSRTEVVEGIAAGEQVVVPDA